MRLSQVALKVEAALCDDPCRGAAESALCCCVFDRELSADAATPYAARHALPCTFYQSATQCMQIKAQLSVLGMLLPEVSFCTFDQTCMLSLRP